MSALRSENLRGDLTEKRSEIVRRIKAQVVAYLRGCSLNSRRLADIVNYIRFNEDDFSEWHQSETAKLFAPRYSETNEKPPATSFSGMGHLAVGESCVARGICQSYLIELWHEALIFLCEIRMCVGRSRAGLRYAFLRSSLRCRTAITLDSLSLLCTFFYLHVKSKCFGT